MKKELPTVVYKFIKNKNPETWDRDKKEGKKLLKHFLIFHNCTTFKITFAWLQKRIIFSIDERKLSFVSYTQNIIKLSNNFANVQWKSLDLSQISDINEKSETKF